MTVRRLILSLCLVAVAGARASAYPALEAPGLYAGGARTEQGEIRVELRLLEHNFFVLSRLAGPGQSAPSRDLTGFWRQVGGGAVLQLTNRHGFLLRLNVGGGNNVYGDFGLAPGEPLQSLTLKQHPYRIRAFDIAGRLERNNGHAILTDSATGRSFQLDGEAAATLPGDGPLFVEATATPVDNGLRVERVRSFSARLPRYAAASPFGDDFTAAVKGRFWSLPGLPRALCAFAGYGKGRGVLEVTGPGLRLAAAYEELAGRRLAFTISDEDARMLAACGAKALLEMFAGVRSWSLEGDVLVLADRRGSFVLEKAGDLERSGNEPM